MDRLSRRGSRLRRPDPGIQESLEHGLLPAPNLCADDLAYASCGGGVCYAVEGCDVVWEGDVEDQAGDLYLAVFVSGFGQFDLAGDGGWDGGYVGEGERAGRYGELGHDCGFNIPGRDVGVLYWDVCGVCVEGEEEWKDWTTGGKGGEEVEDLLGFVDHCHFVYSCKMHLQNCGVVGGMVK